VWKKIQENNEDLNNGAEYPWAFFTNAAYGAALTIK
jgi:hypothetical protein